MQSSHLALVLLCLALLAMCHGQEEKKTGRQHKPIFGFICRFPDVMTGNWTQTDNADVKLRINKQHIHMMGKKFRCIDKHRGLLLVKEEMRGTGLTCIAYDADTDTASLQVSLKMLFPEPKEVRIDWRDQCKDAPEEAAVNLQFTRA